MLLHTARSHPPPRPRRVLARVLGALVLAAVAADQALQHFALADGALGSRRVAPFDPPLFTNRQRAAAARLESAQFGQPLAGENIAYDADLGWVTAGAGYGVRGERLVLTPPKQVNARSPRRIALIGCSFTHGDEVEAHATWAAALAVARPDLELLNLGVGGYGLDQAVLRLERDGAGFAPHEVWIGLMPQALPRLLSIYRPAENQWNGGVAFKPRFRVHPEPRLQDSLELVPCPATSPARAQSLIFDADAFREATRYDAFVRRAPLAYSRAGSHFTHYSGFARLALTWHEARARPGLSSLLHDPDGELPRLVRALCNRAARSAPVHILVLPSRIDLARPVPGLAPLLMRLQDAGHRVIDLTPTLRAAPADWRPAGHYGPLQNAAVGRALADSGKNSGARPLQPVGFGEKNNG